MTNEPSAAVPITREVHYGIEGYADLPLIVLALIFACWKSFQGNRAAWLLVCSLGLFAIKHGLVYLFAVMPDLPPQMWMVHGYVGTVGWLLLAVYCACLAVACSPRQGNSS